MHGVVSCLEGRCVPLKRYNFLGHTLDCLHTIWQHQVAGAEQASELEGNPEEHQWLLASRAGREALPASVIITRLLFLAAALEATIWSHPVGDYHACLC